MISQYLSPEPELHDPVFVMLNAKAAESVLVFAYADNNPITYTDPTGRFVKKGECANWTKAQALAMKWAGCKGGGSGKAVADNECQYQLHKNGGCNVCQFIEEGIGPDALIRSIPFKAHTNAGSYYRSFDWHPEPNSVVLDEPLCRGSAEELAEVMIHEAAHYCSVQTGRLVEDGSIMTPGTGPYFGDVCRSNKGGRIR